MPKKASRKPRGATSPGVLGTRFDAKRKAVYLRELERTGEAAEARRIAGGVSSQTVSRHRKSDADFAAAEVESMERYAAGLGMEIHRRGYVGVEEPVFYKGEKVATVTRYSDALALAHARRHIPEYRDKVTVDQTTRLEGSPLAALAGDLASLQPESRDLLRKILEVEAAKAQEVEE